MSAPLAFDPLADLPTGTLALEASAGTGKTYTLATLATRFLAEGRITASELLVVTFTRAATGELRARVRDRIVAAASHLRSNEASSDDALHRWLGAGTDEQVGSRRQRLERAVGEFDTATITTIHGFAAQVLGALGVGADAPAGTVLVDDLDWRILEVCCDVLAAAAVDPRIDPQHLPSLQQKLVRSVRRAMAVPDAVVAPHDAGSPPADTDETVALLVRRAVSLLRARRRAEATMGFDDLLLELRDALRRHGEAARAAAAVLRGRYRVALIDEFQDTDGVQWDIFGDLFGDPTRTRSGSEHSLVLVGDPKQAIYSFRGADVATYVAAVRGGGVTRRTLGINWRSDDAVLAANEALFEGADFGHGIAFKPVEPAADRRGLRLHRRGPGDPDTDDTVASLSIRCVDAPGLCNDKGRLGTDDARDAIGADLLAHVVDLLDHGSLPDGHGALRAVEPSDIAVLVRTNSDADRFQATLVGGGVPAVQARGTSVLDSPAATQLTLLLEALVRPADPARTRAYALSWFGGHDAAWVGRASDSEITGLQEQLVAWAGALTGRGVVDLLRTVWRETDVVSQVLTLPDGDRSVTDLEHLGELLRLTMGDAPASPAGLLAAMEGLGEAARTRSDAERDTDMTARRVESDARAVQLMTVWVAKGLEFPIVLCPTMWTSGTQEVSYDDPVTGQRVIDMRSRTALKGDATPLRVRSEELYRGEQMRLLYVALTRARHHTALWWANCSGAGTTALARLLFARDDQGRHDPSVAADEAALKTRVPPHDQAVARLEPLSRRAGGDVVEVLRCAGPPPSLPRWSGHDTGTGDEPLAAAVFDRPSVAPLDRRRSRWSFSAIVSRDTTTGDPWDLSVDDEGAEDEQRPPDADPEGGTSAATSGAGVSPLAWLPAGPAFGTLAHDVLERVDFTVGDLAAEVGDVVADQQAWRSLRLRPVGDPRPPGDPDAEAAGTRLLIDGLVTAIRTPLGAELAHPDGTPRCLGDLRVGDRLDELSFDLLLGHDGDESGDDALGPISDRRLGELLADHLPAADPFRRWAEHLAAGAFGVDLAGHLTGSIDAVLRLRGDGDGPDRFVVVDYKTNRLHDHGTVPAPGDYGQASMRRAMVEHHYPLQALLYLVALHRYLRWRLEGYRPEVHLGGAAYLFLRGMTGPAVRTEADLPDGVCTWSVPATAITATSDLLAGHSTTTGLVTS